MFDNVLYQSATDLLAQDVAQDKLPGSLLFAGPASSGKMTTALELARVLSCRLSGAWNCTCPCCRQHKALVSPLLLVMGAGDKSLEIAAARNSLLAQNANNTRHVEAARYLYLRSVRKLTLKFNPILWEGEDKLSKFSPLLQGIDEELEKLEPGRTVPDGAELEKMLDSIEKSCKKLSDSFLYDALPVSQIRMMSSWAHLSATEGRKVVIIENADKMADSARNALLKILEEPPADVVFILTTTRRSSLLPTILSRVRSYVFFERSAEQQEQVIRRVFHYEGTSAPESINAFLQLYLPVNPERVQAAAESYFKTVAGGHVPDIPSIVSSCGNFSPRILFSLFLQGVTRAQRALLGSAAGAIASQDIMAELRIVSTNVGIFNQNPLAALEYLARSIMQINHRYDGILRETIHE